MRCPSPRPSRRVALSALCAAAIAAPCAAQSASPTLFVLGNVSDNVATYIIEDDGTLTFVANANSSDGPQSISLSPSGEFLAVGHGTTSDTTEALNIFRVNSDSTLTLAFAGMTPDSPLDLKWLSDRALAVTRTSISSSQNQVIVYEWDDTAPSLTQIDLESTPGFTAHLAVNPERTLLFSSDSSANIIRSFKINEDGTLDPASTIGASPAIPVDIGVSVDGRYVYVPGGIGGGGNNIAGFEVDSSGTMTALAGQPFFTPGESPKVAAFTSDGRILIAGHGTDATARTFFIDENGALAATGFSFDVGTQGTLGDLVALGDLCFITDESTASDGIRGVYSFRINPDGSFTQLDLEDPGLSRPEYMAVWSPPSIPCPADLDGDGQVGPADLGALLGSWGMMDVPADFDGGGVGSSDLGLLLGSWGPCP
ncbi:MAG: beta-propeller fold lactonase family protein [Planctomycetota bacterium]|nr:beta-propeller fold lactonase family protein [Planctomycetota bacterium]